MLKKIMDFESIKGSGDFDPDQIEVPDTQIDKASAEVMIQSGVDAENQALSMRKWMELYRIANEGDGLTAEERDARMLEVASKSFGEGAEFENVTLLQDLKDRIEPTLVDYRAETEGVRIDPLADTEFADTTNENLNKGQSMRGEDGAEYHPDDGDAYRKAFLHQLK